MEGGLSCQQKGASMDDYSVDLVMKLLTLFSFDIMAFIWGCAHMFYRFAYPTSKAAVKWGWGITNLLSLIATVLYMVIQNMFRFRILIDNNLVSLGDGEPLLHSYLTSEY